MEDDEIKTQMANMEKELEKLKKAKEAVEEENIALKKKDDFDDKMAKYNTFMKETFGTANPPPPYPFYGHYPPPPNPDQDLAEPTESVNGEEEMSIMPQ